MITNPYVALGGIMSGDFAEAIVTSIGGGGPVPANINVVIWSISALFLEPA